MTKVDILKEKLVIYFFSIGRNYILLCYLKLFYLLSFYPNSRLYFNLYRPVVPLD